MPDKYYAINLWDYLNKDNSTYIGEERLYDLLSEFSCPTNPDVEYFLLHNAIEFTKKNQSVTYLVFDTENTVLVGYFSLSLKPISIHITKLSKTMAKKLARTSNFNSTTQTYTTAAYLIAQLGKNYSIAKENQIPGSVLLDFALKRIFYIRYHIGGVMQFLECRNNAFLLDVYTRNHFKPFDTRVVTSPNSEPYVLHQLLKFI